MSTSNKQWSAALALVLAGGLFALAPWCGGRGGMVAARAESLAERGPPVDATTLKHKMIMGYQGWFQCPADNPWHGWVHWMKRPGDVTVDLLPDVSELPPAHRCDSHLTDAQGREVELYSPRDPVVVDLHFQWMQQYGVDGVALQRFATELRPEMMPHLNGVLANVRASAEKYGRVFYVMYDLTGAKPEVLAKVADDWGGLARQGLFDSPAYLHDHGRPVVNLWGLGFVGARVTPVQALTLIQAIRDESAPFGGVTLIGGVPTYWRTLNHDASADPAWRKVYAALDVISPWTVGRFHNAAGADVYAATVRQDIAAAKLMGKDYQPVVFAGFSQHNRQTAYGAADAATSVANQIPRDCGRFYWRQIYNDARAGADTLYNAMFDEMDEGTAMLKTLPSSDLAPTAGGRFVTLDTDGCSLSSDFYLRLAGAAAKVVKHHAAATRAVPVPNAAP